MEQCHKCGMYVSLNPLMSRWMLEDAMYKHVWFGREATPFSIDDVSLNKHTVSAFARNEKESDFEECTSDSESDE